MFCVWELQGIVVAILLANIDFSSYSSQLLLFVRLHETLSCSEAFHSLLLDIDHRYVSIAFTVCPRMHLLYVVFNRLNFSQWRNSRDSICSPAIFTRKEGGKSVRSS